MTFEADEAFERELFAMRAMPSMKLDVEEVIARATRPRSKEKRARAPWAAWIGAAACAAASILGVARAHEPEHASRDAIVELHGGVSDGLSCRSDVSENLLESATSSQASAAMCVADPSSLVCGRDATFSIAKP